MGQTPAPAPPDFPRTLLEFEERFATEEGCRTYFAQVRWPGGFLCPRCGIAGGWRNGRGLWECGDCHHQTSVTAGTIFDGTRKPLRLWFRVLWLVASSKSGVSALAVQRQLGLRRYETAWVWLHKLRRAMVRPGRERLTGRVEVDETYVGGAEEGAVGRGAKTKVLVAIAVEKRGRAMGRIRLQRVPDASAPTLTRFVGETVEPGAEVATDGWEGYGRLGNVGYRHKILTIKGSGKEAHRLLPRVHRVASLLKRWLLGTHQGAVLPDHLEFYLDEFTFRFNRRTSRDRGWLFYRLLQRAAAETPTSWQDVAQRR